jgi:23S rRNA (guanosine2251-2'-O)-methyltransferase
MSPGAVAERSLALPKKSRAFSDRTHRHSDLEGSIRAIGDDDLLDLVEKAAERPPLLLILDGVQDPHNLGACLRTAEGAGVTAVVAPKDRSVSITKAVRTVACGGAERVPFARVTNLARTLVRLKDLGVWVVGTDDGAEKSLYDLELTGPIAIVMGSEGSGVRRLVGEKCDFLARLPMLGEVESLNVSVAAGVCLYEAVRQRTSDR